jgi:trehalose synthase
MYEKVYRKADKLAKKGDILFVIGNNETLVNAVQRFSSVIIQKSIREGFCLSVTEAMWKAKPIVASNVGGIPVQIEDGRNGFLFKPNDIKGFADEIVHLLKNPDEAKDIGQKAKETARQRFLITRLLSDYLYMLNAILNE